MPRLFSWHLLAFGVAFACGHAEPIAARAPEPNGALPLPSDSVLTVRVDLTSLRAELGESLADELVADTLGTNGREQAPELLARSLTRASLLWLATPAAGALDDAERVLVLRGRFTSLSDGAGQGARWSRLESGAQALDVPAAESQRDIGRVYRLPGDEVLIWGPSSEAHPIAQALRGRAEPALAPPERGAVSLAARPEPWLELYARRFPELVDRLRGMQRVQAFAEPTAGTWRADLLVDFGTPEQAAGARDVVKRLKDALSERSCAVGVLARALSVSTFERNLRIQAWLENADLETVKACVLGGGCCA